MGESCQIAHNGRRLPIAQGAAEPFDDNRRLQKAIPRHANSWRRESSQGEISDFFTPPLRLSHPIAVILQSKRRKEFDIAIDRLCARVLLCVHCNDGPAALNLGKHARLPVAGVRETGMRRRHILEAFDPKACAIGDLAASGGTFFDCHLWPFAFGCP